MNRPTPAVESMIDHIYDQFVSTIPPMLAAQARDMPRALGLTARAYVPWSAVFNNAAVLGLPPMLFTGRLIPSTLREAATAAHLFAMIDAFATSRIENGTVKPREALVAVLEQLRDARDRALETVASGRRVRCSYQRAEGVLEEAMIAERVALSGKVRVCWDLYRAVTADKVALAFPAGVEAARAAGMSDADLEMVGAVIEGAALGLKYRDDAVDWMRDHARGRSWATHLVANELDIHGLDDRALERRLAKERVLVRMLLMSAREFSRASEAAARMGAKALAEWALKQAAISARLSRAEAKEPGFAVRWDTDRKRRRARTQPIAA